MAAKLILLIRKNEKQKIINKKRVRPLFNIDLVILNFYNYEIMGIFFTGEPVIECLDGHKVRSSGEQIIDNYLHKRGIIHEYEKLLVLPLDYGKKRLCDFYLPEYNVYIEFWGMMHDSEYRKRKAEKIALYEKNKLNRIDLIETSLLYLDRIIPHALSFYKCEKNN